MLSRSSIHRVLLRGRGLALILILLLLALADYLPLASMFARGVKEFQTSKNQALEFTPLLDALWASARLGLATTFIALLFGACYAFLVEMARPRLLWLWRFLGLLPLAIPSYLVALSAIAIFGPKESPTSGLLGESLYSWPCCAFILGVCSMPFVAVPLGSSIRRMDPRMLEAALLTRGTRGAFFMLLKNSRPALLLGGLLVFAYTLVSFTTPELLRVKALTELVYARFSDFRDVPGALWAMIPLLLLSLLCALGIGRRLSLAEFDNAEPRDSFQWFESPWPRRLAPLALLLLLTPSLLFPCVVLLDGVLAAPETKESGFLTLFERSFDEHAWTTFRIALFTALLAWGVGLALASSGLHRVIQGKWLGLFLVPASIPGPILGIGLVLFWNRPGEPWLSFYDSEAMLVFASLGRFLPFGLLLSLMILRRHRLAEEETAVLGARAPVLLRGHFREHALTAALVYALSAGEYSASVLVSPPGSTPLAVKIMGFVHFGRTGEVAAMSLILIAVIFLPCAFFLLCAGFGRGRRVG